jgi:hypothetical protein
MYETWSIPESEKLCQDMFLKSSTPISLPTWSFWNCTGKKATGLLERSWLRDQTKNPTRKKPARATGGSRLSFKAAAASFDSRRVCQRFTEPDGASR